MTVQGSSHERRGHFRGKVRLGRALPVRIAANPMGLPVAKAVAASWRAAQTLDIGVGGAFIVDADLLIGAHLWVELQLPSTDQRFVLPAVVRWVGERVDFTKDVAVLSSAPHSTGTAPDPQPILVGHGSATAGNPSLVRGGGVQFVDVEVDVLLELNDYFEAL